ncbi:MAG: hypothetical protein V1701_08230 [Planctomycetota bacterium]
MAFVKKFELKLYVPEHWEVAADMVERWANGLKNAAETMNDRRQAKIPDDGTFINEMAGRAAQDFRQVLNPAYITKGGRSVEEIQDTHKTNVTGAFNIWNDKINDAFATKDGIVAKDFKAKIDRAKNRWALQIGAKTLRLTGDKIRGRSVAPIAAFFLVGDMKAQGWMRPSDAASGTPYNVARDGEASTMKTAIQQRLVQGGMMVINSEFGATTIARQNLLNTAVLNGLRDTAKCDAFVAVPAPDTCYCVWEMDGNILFLHIQVGVTIP